MIIDGYVADVMKGKINISTPISITADDVVEISNKMKNNEPNKNITEKGKTMSEYKISIDDTEHLMNYQSPVQLAINKWTNEIVKQEDNCIMAQIKHQIGVEVDKDELIKALDYDRKQYSKGFKNGYDKRDSEIVRCKNCIHRRQVTDTWFYCEKIYSNMSGLHKRVGDNFYCKDGERKESDS